MRYWFTSDYHLGHANIIKYCNRPFSSLEEMNNTIIKNHNERVKEEDTVFHVGDFCFKNSSGGKVGEGVQIKSSEWEKKLNGKIIHIRGNHDKNNSTKTLINWLTIKYGGKYIYLIHRPERYNANYIFNFVGHVHDNWKIKNIKGVNLINVGVDVWNFKPITYEEIMKRYHTWKRKNITTK